MKNILVSIEFDKGASLLLSKAAELARAFGSKIWIIHIAASEGEYIGYAAGPQYIRDIRKTELKEEHKMLQDLTSGIKEMGLEADALLLEGATIELVLKEAKKLDADLIICGHHDRNFIYRAILGSVSQGLLRSSKIPLLIVPFGE